LIVSHRLVRLPRVWSLKSAAAYFLREDIIKQGTIRFRGWDQDRLTSPRRSFAARRPRRGSFTSCLHPSDLQYAALDVHYLRRIVEYVVKRLPAKKLNALLINCRKYFNPDDLLELSRGQRRRRRAADDDFYEDDCFRALPVPPSPDINRNHCRRGRTKWWRSGRRRRY
jgi:hypothetical protein